MNGKVSVNAQVSITNILYMVPGVSVFFTTQTLTFVNMHCLCIAIDVVSIH